jgi:hypothetical protein
MLTYAHNNK